MSIHPLSLSKTPKPLPAPDQDSRYKHLLNSKIVNRSNNNSSVYYMYRIDWIAMKNMNVGG